MIIGLSLLSLLVFGTITNIVGLPGSGKTYDIIRKIIDNLKSGRVVYTNIDGLAEQEYQEHLKIMSGLTDLQFHVQFHFLSDDEVLTFWRVAKEGSLIVLDEVQNYFNSRDWKVNGDILKEMGAWACTHRHLGYDVILIAPYSERVDKQLRELAEYTYKYKKNTFMGKFFENTYFRYIYQDWTDDGNRAIKTDKCVYDKSFFGCYKSYNNKNVKELKVMKRPNILNHWVVWCIPVLFGVLIWLIFFKSGFMKGDIFGVGAMQAKQRQVMASVHHSAPPVVYGVKEAPHDRFISPLQHVKAAVQASDLPGKNQPVDLCSVVIDAEISGVSYVTKHCSAPDRMVRYIDGKEVSSRYVHEEASSGMVATDHGVHAPVFVESKGPSFGSVGVEKEVVIPKQAINAPVEAVASSPEGFMSHSLPHTLPTRPLPSGADGAGGGHVNVY